MTEQPSSSNGSGNNLFPDPFYQSQPFLRFENGDADTDDQTSNGNVGEEEDFVSPTASYKQGSEPIVAKHDVTQQAAGLASTMSASGSPRYDRAANEERTRELRAKLLARRQATPAAITPANQTISTAAMTDTQQKRSTSPNAATAENVEPNTHSSNYIPSKDPMPTAKAIISSEAHALKAKNLSSETGVRQMSAATLPGLSGAESHASTGGVNPKMDNITSQSDVNGPQKKHGGSQHQTSTVSSHADSETNKSLSIILDSAENPRSKAPLVSKGYTTPEPNSTLPTTTETTVFTANTVDMQDSDSGDYYKDIDEWLQITGYYSVEEWLQLTGFHDRAYREQQLAGAHRLKAIKAEAEELERAAEQRIIMFRRGESVQPTNRDGKFHERSSSAMPPPPLPRKYANGTVDEQLKHNQSPTLATAVRSIESVKRPRSTEAEHNRPEKIFRSIDSADRTMLLPQREGPMSDEDSSQRGEPASKQRRASWNDGNKSALSIAPGPGPGRTSLKIDKRQYHNANGQGRGRSPAREPDHDARYRDGRDFGGNRVACDSYWPNAGSKSRAHSPSVHGGHVSRGNNHSEAGARGRGSAYRGHGDNGSKGSTKGASRGR